MEDLSALDVFYGDLTVAHAHVYARLPRPADSSGLTLVGQVRGPRCLLAETLPVTVPLADLGPGPTMLARAVVPDPCFWSPDLPAIYDVTVELRHGMRTLAKVHHEIGLKAFGIRDRRLALEGKRWVLRGVCQSSTIAKLPRQWREVQAGYITNPYETSGLSEASEQGVLTAVDLACRTNGAPQRLRDLAKHPAAALVIVREGLPRGFTIQNTAPNLRLVQPVQGASPSIEPWAQLLWLENANPESARRLAVQTQLPIIAARRLTERVSLAEARAACDALQRDLAGAGQFAGYVV